MGEDIVKVPYSRRIPVASWQLASSLQADSVNLAGSHPTRCAKFGTEIPHKRSHQLEAMESALCIYGTILGT